jgi:toxin ParE1/3/4
VKTYTVSFRRRAEADLFELYEHIAESAGRTVAGHYIDRLEAACQALAHYPNRGRKRDDLRRGLRILGFERRVAIAFVVDEREVVIARIFYGGREYEGLLRVGRGD